MADLGAIGIDAPGEAIQIDIIDASANLPPAADNTSQSGGEPARTTGTPIA